MPSCHVSRFRSPDLWENEVAPISVIGTAGEGVDEFEVGPGVRQFGGVELGQQVVDGSVRTRIGHRMHVDRQDGRVGVRT